MYILFLGYVIAATGALSYVKWNNRDVQIEVFDPTNTAGTCKNLTTITARLGSTGGLVQNKILICGGWSYLSLPLYVVWESHISIFNILEIKLCIFTVLKMWHKKITFYLFSQLKWVKIMPTLYYVYNVHFCVLVNENMILFR